MVEAINYLTSLLKEELNHSTGFIEIDRENGSYYKIRKLVSAIRTLSEDPLKTNIKMEIQAETWHVSIHEPIEERIKLLKGQLLETWKHKGFQDQQTIEKSQELDEAIIQYQKMRKFG